MAATDASADGEPVPDDELHERNATRSNYALIQRLRDRPRTRVEPPKPGEGRGLVAKLKAPVVSEGQSAVKTRGTKDADTVYYLYGDERRAIRTFIEQNTAYVRSCVEEEAPNNILKTNWDPILWQLLVEEYHLGGYANGGGE